MRMRGAVVTAMTLGAIVSCTGAATGPDGRLVGEWGGVGAAFVAADSGGSVEFDCAHGTFAPLFAEDGRFQVAGTWSREGGPAFGDEGRTLPATYAGQALDGRLVFTVHVEGEEQPFGPYTVRRDEEPLLRKCL